MRRRTFEPEADYRAKARETQKGSCSRKEVYASKKAAIEASAKVSLRNGTLTEPYKCAFCHKYHLSKRSSIINRGGKVMSLPTEYQGQVVLFDETGPYVETEVKCIKCGKTEKAIKRVSVVDGKYTRFQGITVDESVMKRTKAGAKTYVHAKGCSEVEEPLSTVGEKEQQPEEKKEVKTNGKSVDFTKLDAEVVLELTSMIDPRNKEVSDGAARGMAYTFMRQITEALLR